ncbi:MAG TPA: alpha/beta family hydrolase [Alphaproteobacteria bacterium]|nr:alpha/beta family hydrolase [Alphaproteobacteria bacterium]
MAKERSGVAKAPDFLFDGPNTAKLTLILAHGAGAPMDSPFMETVAKGLAKGGIRVARFEFPYMAERRRTAKKRPPDSLNKLLESFRAAARALEGKAFAIGGKSMGGRIASMVADEVGAKALVCLGYPFHAPGKPPSSIKGDARTEHLRKLKTPTLILQGTRDPFGGAPNVKALKLPKTIRVHWLEDGEHSFKPRKASGRTEEENLAEAVDAAVSFLRDF